MLDTPQEMYMMFLEFLLPYLIVTAAIVVTAIIIYHYWKAWLAQR